MFEKVNEGGELNFENAGVKEALESGKLGFEEISVMGTEELFNKASINQVFIVSDDRFVEVFSGRARNLGRKDLVFEAQSE